MYRFFDRSGKKKAKKIIPTPAVTKLICSEFPLVPKLRKIEPKTIVAKPIMHIPAPKR